MKGFFNKNMGIVLMCFGLFLTTFLISFSTVTRGKVYSKRETIKSPKIAQRIKTLTPTPSIEVKAIPTTTIVKTQVIPEPTVYNICTLPPKPNTDIQPKLGDKISVFEEAFGEKAIFDGVCCYRFSNDYILLLADEKVYEISLHNSYFSKLPDVQTALNYAKPYIPDDTNFIRKEKLLYFQDQENIMKYYYTNNIMVVLDCGDNGVYSTTIFYNDNINNNVNNN